MAENVKTYTGFTLLELMISLTIVSLIVLIIFGCFRVGIRAWERGERDVDARQRIRIVMGLMKHQLASACICAETGIDGKGTPFKGSRKNMEFTSRISLIPRDDPGLSYVKYVVEPEDKEGKKDEKLLKLYEKNIVFIKPGKEFKGPSKDDFFEILSGVREIGFEYLKGVKDGEFEWQPAWDPEVDKGLPLAVRVTVKINEGEKEASVCILARILSEDT